MEGPESHQGGLELLLGPEKRKLIKEQRTVCKRVRNVHFRPSALQHYLRTIPTPSVSFYHSFYSNRIKNQFVTPCVFIFATTQCAVLIPLVTFLSLLGTYKKVGDLWVWGACLAR